MLVWTSGAVPLDGGRSLKKCATCKTEYPLNEENFYVARSRFAGKPDVWQSHCRKCWKDINAANKLRRKIGGM